MNDPIVLLWHWLAVGQPGAPLVPTWLTVTVALATAGMLLEALLLLAWHRCTGRGLPPGSLLPTLNKKLIANSLNVLFDKLNGCQSKALVGEISGYLMLAVYRMFRLVYASNAKNAPAKAKIVITISSCI